MPVANLFLNSIIAQVNQYVGSLDPTQDSVILGNIATSKLAGGDEQDLNEKIVVSLVNIEEEAALKNKGISIPGLQNFNYPAPVYINLYLLFTANFEDYGTAIDFLFRVVEFFQSKKIFKLKNILTAPVNGAASDSLNTEVVFDLYTLNFEQVNNLWSSLGGKQMPFVLYRARLIPVFVELPLGRNGFITEIDLESSHLNLSH